MIHSEDYYRLGKRLSLPTSQFSNRFRSTIYHQPHVCDIETEEKKKMGYTFFIRDLCNAFFIYAHEMIYDTFRI